MKIQQPAGDPRDQSEFNMAFSYLGRINILLSVCNESSIMLNADLWFHTLCALFRELSTNMSEAEQKVFKQKIMELSDRIFRFTRYNSLRRRPGIPKELYESLQNFETDLRKVIRDAGLEVKLKDDPKFALGSMG